MKINNILLTLTLTTLSSYSLQAAVSAETLYDAKCAVCHVKVRPQDKSKLLAPPLNGIMRHVKMQHATKESAVTFIRNYVLDPQQSKAVCNAKSIQRFGLMPSQKGVVSEDELTLMATWMYDNYPQFSQMNATPQSKQAQGNKKRKTSSPFLINSGLPHMTMLIKNNWESKELALTPTQKEKLLLVRKATIGGIKAVKPKVMQLEKEIKNLTMTGADTSIITPKVDQLAKYKAELTKVQIACIHNSKNILSSAQVAFLLQKQ